MVKSNYVRKVTVIIFCFFSVCISVQAAVTGDIIEYTFGGRLVAQRTTCIVNDNREIDIQFGNVNITKVSTGQYILDIKYTLDCGNATDINTVYMKIQAISEPWDDKAINTSADGLGVRILSDGTSMELNKDIKINIANQPVLQAQLVQKPDTTLSEQSFSAVGSLLVEYE